MAGEADSLYLLASDAGYGFIATLEDLASRNKAGKSILRVPAGGKAIVPAPVPRDTECLIAAVSNIGRLLLFEILLRLGQLELLYLYCVVRQQEITLIFLGLQPGSQE